MRSVFLAALPGGDTNPTFVMLVAIAISIGIVSAIRLFRNR